MPSSTVYSTIVFAKYYMGTGSSSSCRPLKCSSYIQPYRKPWASSPLQTTNKRYATQTNNLCFQNPFSLFCFFYNQCFSLYFSFNSVSIFKWKICVSSNFRRDINKEFVVFLPFEMVGLLKNLPLPFRIALYSLFGITTFHYIIFSESLRALPRWYNNLKIFLNL